MATSHRRAGWTTHLLTLAAACLLITTSAAAQEVAPVRNDIAQAGDELLVLRHQKLVEGSHERFYQLSRDGVWPWFEKLGTRVVGQWQVVHPDGGGSQDYDEGYRLARYRSLNHWVQTRGRSLGGDGPDSEASREALRARRELLLGSDGVVFLHGSMAPGGPYHMPGLGESYRLSSDNGPVGAGDPQPVRHGVARRGEEIVTLRSFRIRKGTFAEFNRLSVEGVWPYFEKMGARIVGQWKAVYPTSVEAERGAPDPGDASDEYDVVYMMARYASHEHWQATRPAVMAQLGGNGPDYDACVEALSRRRALTLETEVRFLRGHFYQSPPIYLPALDERYEVVPP